MDIQLIPNTMNTVIENISYLITGTKSTSYVKKLKPYLLVFHLNLLGLVVLKVVKVLMEVL
jgi:hypothetical protein